MRPDLKITGTSTVLKRLLYYVGLILFVLVLIFLLFSALPSDPARAQLGMLASEASVQALREELGLNRSLPRQFIEYFANLFSLNFGISFASRRPVAQEILPAFAATLSYAFLALLIAASYSFLAAMAAQQPRIRMILAATHAFLTSMPSLVVAIAFGWLVLLSNAFAFIADISSRNMVMASFVLSVYPACSLAQILISEIATVKNSAAVRVAESYGFGKNRIFFFYLFRSALLPWLAQISNIAASLLAGSIIVEIVFSLPGIGRLIVQSVLLQDYPMIQGIVLLSSISFLFLHAVMEWIYARLNPLSSKGNLFL